MLINITEYFIESGREWKVGHNPDVPREVAARWIADGKATADTDGARNQFPVSGGGSRIALPRWDAAISALRAGTISRNVKLLVVADSTGAGAFATGTPAYGRNDLSLCWPKVLGDLLAAEGLPVNNSFVAGDLTNTTVPATVAGHDTRRSFGAGWVFNASFQAVGNNCPTNVTAGDQSVMSFTPSAPFDTIEVVYVTNPAYGKWVIAVDGGAPLGAVIDSSPALSVLTATRTCELGLHRVDIYRSAATGADGSIPIVSIRTYNSASRTIDILNASAGGTTTALQSDDSAVYKAAPILQSYAPDLAIVCLDINDWIGGVTAGTYDLTTTATHAYQVAKLIRKLQTTGDVILMTGAPSKISSYARAVQDAILQATRQVAAITGCKLVDVSALWGEYEAAKLRGFYGADTVHPVSAGYANIAKLTMAYGALLV